MEPLSGSEPIDAPKHQRKYDRWWYRKWHAVEKYFNTIKHFGWSSPGLTNSLALSPVDPIDQRLDLATLTSNIT